MRKTKTLNQAVMRKDHGIGLKCLRNVKHLAAKNCGINKDMKNIMGNQQQSTAREGTPNDSLYQQQ